jgi:uncharacterized protein YkwD
MIAGTVAGVVAVAGVVQLTGGSSSGDGSITLTGAAAAPKGAQGPAAVQVPVVNLPNRPSASWARPVPAPTLPITTRRKRNVPAGAPTSAQVTSSVTTVAGAGGGAGSGGGAGAGDGSDVRQSVTVNPPTSSAPSPKPSSAPTTKTSQAPASGSYIDQVVALTNEQRLANGCKALTVNPILTSVAQAHSADMAKRNFFDHNNPDGKSPFDRMTAAGYKYRMAAENIAAGYPTAAAVVDGWMNSQGHRENILNCGLTQIGVGYVTGGSYGSYWTQDFGTPM